MSEVRVMRREALVEKLNSRDATHRRSLFSCAAISSQHSLFPIARSPLQHSLRRSVRSRLLAFHNPQSDFRLGVTLIELLLVITIIATLSAAFLGASRSAMEHASAARTKTTIAKIHGLLMDRLETYTTRRVDIKPIILQALRDPGDFPGRLSGEALADARLLAIRELMKLEMPDRWSDVTGDSIVTLPPSTLLDDFLKPLVLQSRPSLSLQYLRRYKRITSPDEEVIQRHQGAECLYMVVMLATGDGEARALFSQQDIGDTDNDGAPEFLDGWGRPISYLRWPAGFVLQSQIMTADAENSFDPFDFFRRDDPSVISPPTNRYSFIQFDVDAMRNRSQIAQAFRLVPLIYSSGSDGISDINTSTDLVTRLDPYALDSNTGEFEFGVPRDDASNPDGDDNSLDNIHNHLLDGR